MFEVARDLCARLCVYLMWTLRFRERTNVQDCIVTITSYPKRFKYLHLTLMSVLFQRKPAKRVVLWIAEQDFRLLPQRVLRLRRYGLEIKVCEDLRSYKKIIPALLEFPNENLVIADDDVFYWDGWLAALCRSHQLSGGVVCHRMHRVVLEGGAMVEYKNWEWNVQDGLASPLNFPTGCGGVLYPAGALNPSHSEIKIGLDCCPRGDDIWLWWLSNRRGLKISWTGIRKPLRNWRGSQEDALWHSNVLGGNDDQLAALAARVGPLL